MSSEQLQRGLHASVKIFNLTQAILVALDEKCELEASVSRDDIVTMKRAAVGMNRALTALVRESHDTENRLTLELHMLRGIMQRENTDRDANRARVFELVRRYSSPDDAMPVASGTTNAAASNPLNAPSASSVAIDRALASLERTEQSVRDLSPIGRFDMHGAGLLSAKLKMQPTVEITKKRTRRPKTHVVG